MGLANAGLQIGACSSQVVIVPLIRYFVDEYGFRGAALIYGALVMNAFVGVSLFHPLKWHMQTSTTRKQCHDDHESPLQQTPLAEEQEDTTDSKSDLANDEYHEEYINPGVIHYLKSDDLQPTTVTTSINGTGTSIPEANSSSPDHTREINDRDFVYHIKRMWVTLVRVVKATKSDLRIFRFRQAVVFITSSVCSSSSYMNFQLLMPFAMQVKGRSLEDAAWAMSVFGTFNMAIRLIVSPLSDWKRFNHRICLMFSYALNGSALLGM